MDKTRSELEVALRQFHSFQHKALMRHDFWLSLCDLAEKLSLLGKTSPEVFLRTADSEVCLELLSQVVQRLSNLSDALEQCIPRLEE